MERPPAPPEAVLIRLAREAAGIPVAVAAKNAGVSVARWSQIESGSEIRHGSASPVTGRAGTIARMAAEVGVTPERMEAEGRRPDAAEILREIRRQQEPAPSPDVFPLPKPTPAMARRLLPLLAEAEGRVKVAQDTHPGQRLTGHQVYPDLPQGEVFWDEAAAAGFMPDHMPTVVATLLAWYAEIAEAKRQNGSAAGLSHRPLIHAVR